MRPRRSSTALLPLRRRQRRWTPLRHQSPSCRLLASSPLPSGNASTPRSLSLHRLRLANASPLTVVPALTASQTSRSSRQTASLLLTPAPSVRQFEPRRSGPSNYAQHLTVGPSPFNPDYAASPQLPLRTLGLLQAVAPSPDTHALAAILDLSCSLRRNRRLISQVHIRLPSCNLFPLKDIWSDGPHKLSDVTARCIIISHRISIYHARISLLIPFSTAHNFSLHPPVPCIICAQNLYPVLTLRLFLVMSRYPPSSHPILPSCTTTIRVSQGTLHSLYHHLTALLLSLSAFKIISSRPVSDTPPVPFRVASYPSPNPPRNMVSHLLCPTSLHLRICLSLGIA